MCLLHLLKFSFSWGSWNSTALVLNGWRWWWGAGRSRQGRQHSLGRREMLALHIPVCCSEVPHQGCALGSACGMTRAVQMLTGHGTCRTCWCSAVHVIWRNSVFSFPSFQEHQLMQFHTCSSSLKWCPTLTFLQFKLVMAHCSPVGLLLLWGAMAAPSNIEELSKKKKSVNDNIMVSIFPRNRRNGSNEFLQCYFCTSVLARFIISDLQSLPSVSSSV